MSEKVWNTKLPELPEGFRWDIQVVPGGTYVRVYQGMYNSEPMLEHYIDGQLHEPKFEYLTKVWNAAYHFVNQLADRNERRTWVRTEFGI